MRADDPKLPKLPTPPTLPGELWEGFAPMVFRLLRRTLGPEQPVDDAVQQVFLRVFDDLRRRPPPARDPGDASLEAIVLSAVVRVASARLRWRRIRGRFRRRGSSAIVSLYRAMGRLRARDQVAFAFYFIDRIGVSEIAEALGESVPATDRRLRRSWDRLAARVGRTVRLTDMVPFVPSTSGERTGRPFSDPN